MRDFADTYRWMDEFEPCCRGNLKSRGQGWKFPQEDGNPGFEAFLCVVCGRIWFKDDATGKFYTFRGRWISEHPIVFVRLPKGQ